MTCQRIPDQAVQQLYALYAKAAFAAAALEVASSFGREFRAQILSILGPLQVEIHQQRGVYPWAFPARNSPLATVAETIKQHLIVPDGDNEVSLKNAATAAKGPSQEKAEGLFLEIYTTMLRDYGAEALALAAYDRQRKNTASIATAVIGCVVGLSAGLGWRYYSGSPEIKAMKSVTVLSFLLIALTGKRLAKSSFPKIQHAYERKVSETAREWNRNRIFTKVSAGEVSLESILDNPEFRLPDGFLARSSLDASKDPVDHLRKQIHLRSTLAGRSAQITSHDAV